MRFLIVLGIALASYGGGRAYFWLTDGFPPSSLYEVFARYRDQETMDQAKQLLHEVFLHMSAICSKGVRDGDSNSGRNIGLVRNRLMTLDIGTFTEDESIVSGAKHAEQVIEQSEGLRIMFEEIYPDMLPAYYDELSKLTQS